jgi:hypothetical protein
MLKQALYQPYIGLAPMLMVTTQASTYGSLGLQGELTIPYADLTEATVIGWVKASMGDETVAAHEAAVAAQIADAKEPKVAVGTPW